MPRREEGGGGVRGTKARVLITTTDDLSDDPEVTTDVGEGVGEVGEDGDERRGGGGRRGAHPRTEENRVVKEVRGPRTQMQVEILTFATRVTAYELIFDRTKGLS